MPQPPITTSSFRSRPLLGEDGLLPSFSGWPRVTESFRALAVPWVAGTEVSQISSLSTINPGDTSLWTDRFHRAGIIADRRTSPDLFAQLTHTARRPIDTVICNVLDVDPAACLNSSLAAQFPIELVAGTTLISKLSAARRSAIIADSRVPNSWLTGLRRTAAVAGMRVESIINDYPQSDPTLMLYTLLNRRLRPGRLPTEQGVVLFDAAAAVAIGRLVLMDEPMLQSPLVLRDHTLNHSHYLTAPVGQTLAEICQRIGAEWRGRVIRAGDLLRDIVVHPEAVVGGGELIFHLSLPSPSINPSPCIRCGWCVDACPTRVQPAAILEASQQADIDMAEHAGIEACIECGVCAYVCPSQLPLLDGIRKMRDIEKSLRTFSTRQDLSSNSSEL